MASRANYVSTQLYSPFKDKQAYFVFLREQDKREISISQRTAVKYGAFPVHVDKNTLFVVYN